MEEKGYCWIRFADNINIYIQKHRKKQLTFTMLSVSFWVQKQDSILIRRKVVSSMPVNADSLDMNSTKYPVMSEQNSTAINPKMFISNGIHAR